MDIFKGKSLLPNDFEINCNKCTLLKFVVNVFLFLLYIIVFHTLYLCLFITRTFYCVNTSIINNWIIIIFLIIIIIIIVICMGGMFELCDWTRDYAASFSRISGDTSPGKKLAGV